MIKKIPPMADCIACRDINSIKPVFCGRMFGLALPRREDWPSRHGMLAQRTKLLQSADWSACSAFRIEPAMTCLQSILSSFQLQFALRSANTGYTTCAHPNMRAALRASRSLRPFTLSPLRA